MAAQVSRYLTLYKGTLRSSAAAFAAVSDAPAALHHARFACPGAPAAEALGWSQAGLSCDTCMQSKTIKTDVSRTPVPREPRCGAKVAGDILGPFTPTKFFFFYVTSFTLYFNHMQKSACFLHMLPLFRLLLWLLEYLHLAE